MSTVDIASRKRPRKSESVAISLNLNLKKRLKLFRDDLFKKQKIQFEKVVLDKSTKEFGIREIE